MKIKMIKYNQASDCLNADKCKSAMCLCFDRCNKYKPTLINTQIIEMSLWDIFKSLFCK